MAVESEGVARNSDPVLQGGTARGSALPGDSSGDVDEGIVPGVDATSEVNTNDVATVIDIGIGHKVLIAANLGLSDESDLTAGSAGLARALHQWEGPGLVVVAGGLFDLDSPSATAVIKALATHHELTEALRKFASSADRDAVCLPGRTDPWLGSDPKLTKPLSDIGVSVYRRLDLSLITATGTHKVRVVGADDEEGPRQSSDRQGTDASTPITVLRSSMSDAATDESQGRDDWQDGVDRLADPSTLHRFLTSRLLYRKMARYGWYLAVPFLLVALLRIPMTTGWLDHLWGDQTLPGRALDRAQNAGWGSRILVAGLLGLLGFVVLAAALRAVSRKAWIALGGGRLPRVFEEDTRPSGGVNDNARGTAAGLLGLGWSGMVTGSSLQAEMTDLGYGFFACPGTSGRVVEEYPGRLGLPPVFVEHGQLAWVELETGAGLHARLLMSRNDSPPKHLLERFATRYRLAHDPHPVVVAAHPHGVAWPPPPDLRALQRRSRRARRWAATAIAVTGAMDLVSAVSPPLRDRLHLVLQVLPLGVTQAAGALVTLAGFGLLAVARGIRRGQHRAWQAAVLILATTLLLHLARGGAVEASVVSGLVLILMMVARGQFRAESDRASARSAITFLGGGLLGMVTATSVITFSYLHISRRHPHFQLSFIRTFEAVAQRLVGVRSIALPDRLDDFLWPSLLATGLSVTVIALILITRPVVDRHPGWGRIAELRARSLIARHGRGTLDYFALRSDKRWFFHRDTLVAYAIYGGVCLVSPDPIGPSGERMQAWASFRQFADAHGWTVCVTGASEDWLPIYRAVGMHDIYLGDEAVVDAATFSLAGGQMKGLRQAYNRIAKYGYTASFHDPAKLDRDTAQLLVGLMSQSRRGDVERGFSMMLGRIFDPRDDGLLLCVVTGPDGKPAAMCQFVPARGINGYSLDLMRRDKGEHPNGLLDFALISTVEEVRRRGGNGLSLNFAAMRSILEGERGDGALQRVERWALVKMSAALQIESLWRFNSKYQPTWMPRYVVYDSAEHLVPSILANLRAESLWEMPLVGGMLSRSARKKAKQASRTYEAGGAGWLADLTTAAADVDMASRSTDEPAEDMIVL